MANTYREDGKEALTDVVEDIPSLASDAAPSAAKPAAQSLEEQINALLPSQYVVRFHHEAYAGVRNYALICDIGSHEVKHTTFIEALTKNHVPIGTLNRTERKIRATCYEHQKRQYTLTAIKGCGFISDNQRITLAISWSEGDTTYEQTTIGLFTAVRAYIDEVVGHKETNEHE